MNPLVKLALGLVVIVGALSLLAVLYVGARERGKVSHCRNNLRHLGILAVINWQEIAPEETGRRFWQGVRVVKYRNTRGQWKYPDYDPFICPVLNRTSTNMEDSSAIDYRGPRTIREFLRDTPKEEPIGADRPGNHPGGGGHVLRIDTSVDESERVRELVEAAKAEDPIWSAADRVLTD